MFTTSPPISGGCQPAKINGARGTKQICLLNQAAAAAQRYFVCFFTASVATLGSVRDDISPVLMGRGQAGLLRARADLNKLVLSET